MENEDLAWIADVIEKLQVPQIYNERERLTKILKRVAPALIRTLDYTAVVGYISCTDDDEIKKTGETCNSCGADYEFGSNYPRHRIVGQDREGKGGEPCRYEELVQLLKEEEKKEDK